MSSSDASTTPTEPLPFRPWPRWRILYMLWSNADGWHTKGQLARSLMVAGWRRATTPRR